MSAKVNIVQPKYGTLTVLDSRHSSYTVSYSPGSTGSKFHGIRVYCEACNTTLLSSSSYTATFDLSGLEDSGHPGPFDISAVTSGLGDLYVFAEASPPEGGTVKPAERAFEDVVAGQTCSGSVTATPADGWAFLYWEREDTGKQFTSRTLNYSLKFSGDGYHDVLYTAYFDKATTLVNPAATLTNTAGFYTSTISQTVDEDGTVTYTYKYRVSRGDALTTIDLCTINSKHSCYRGTYDTLTASLSPEAVALGITVVGWTTSSTSCYDNPAQGGPSTSYTVYVPPCYASGGSLRVHLHLVNTVCTMVDVRSDSDHGGGTGVRYYDSSTDTWKRPTTVETFWYKNLETGSISCVPVGSRVRISASVRDNPVNGVPWKFHGWSNGVDDSTYEFTADTSYKFTAFFCLHALVYNESDGDSLEHSGTGALFYHCKKPPQDTSSQ